MAPSTSGILASANEHLTVGLYAAVALACLAFVGMLLAPDAQAQSLLSAAWLCMAGAIACLAGRAVLALLMPRQPTPGAACHTPQQ